MTVTACIYVLRATWGCLNCHDERPRDGSKCCPSPRFDDVRDLGDGEEEIELEVSGTVTYERGDHSQPGGFTVEDVEATCDGKPFALSASEMDDADEALIEAAADEDEGRRADYWDSRADR